MMAKGRDVSEFYPDVVRNVIVKAVEVKKLIYTYLVHHAVSAWAAQRGRGRAWVRRRHHEGSSCSRLRAAPPRRDQAAASAACTTAVVAERSHAPAGPWALRSNNPGVASSSKPALPLRAAAP